MACCHSITYVNGALVGDPLEIQMFESTEWQLDELNEASNTGIGDDLVLAYARPPIDNKMMSSRKPSYISSDSYANEKQYELAIIKRYDFESKLQRMSVIVKNKLDQSFRAYVKGSPEKIADLCDKSTLPENFDKVLETYT